MIGHLEDGVAPCFQVVRECRELVEEAGLEVPSWTELSVLPSSMLRRNQNQTNHGKSGSRRPPRQLEIKFLSDVVRPGLHDSRRAMLRSQHGPLASAAALPTSRARRITPQPFRLLLCRRLHLPLPLSHPTCRCGRQLDVFGHPRAACPQAGVLGKSERSLSDLRRNTSLQGGRRSGRHEHVRARHGLGSNALDATQARDRGERSDIVARSPAGHRHDDGVSSQEGPDGQAKSCKPRWCRSGGGTPQGGSHPPRTLRRERMVAHEWWSKLARAKARSVPLILRCRAEQAWRLRWASILACSAAMAFAASLLDLKLGGGVDGDVPRTHKVVNDFRHDGLV